MNILKLRNKLNFLTEIINNDCTVSNISFDSRTVEENYAFIAIKGTKTDGHNYIEQVIEKGAKLIVCETLPEKINSKTSYLVVKDSSYALGIIASEFYDNPSKKLKLIGVTGTNGKTTIATSLYELTQKLGYKSGLISTIKVLIDRKKIDSTHTTPDPIRLNEYLYQMVTLGCDYCFMEVSSHSTVQNRIAGLNFSGGIFTNITHDHLDFHKTYKEYIRAKQMFFDMLPPESFALTNLDDKNGAVMLQNSKAQKHTYSLNSLSEFKAEILEMLAEGMLLKIDANEIWTKLTGKFNAYNLLAIYGAAILLDFPQKEVLQAISELSPVAGRFETIYGKNNITGIVDYAHTPDALKNVLETILEINKGNTNIITVVGTGGDRDKTKRPEMAKIAAEMSNLVILTSDNPRTENPEDILDDMEKGLNKITEKKCLRITNREQAIKTACKMANPGDIILVAGKGHETYQEINGVKLHFDDKEILNQYLNS